MEEIIYTIEGVPSELGLVFENFIDILITKQFWVKGTQYQILEPGPRENLTTVFQLIPTSNGIVKFDIKFIEKQTGIDVFYDRTIDFNVPDMIAGKLLKRMIEKQRDFIERGFDSQLIPLIQVSIKEAIRKVEKSLEQDLEEGKETAKEALQILKVKFAKGEISEEEYLRKKELLEE
ncbi:MAG: SHOCT domain-containing protein [Promethearchaeota archaeon]